MNQTSKTLSCLWPYFALSALLILLFYVTGFDRNWPHWVDQELTLSYNGLLVHSGSNQEYLDHPGFFSIHLISYLIAITNFLGIYQLQSVADLNNSPSMLASIKDLIITTRHAALITSVAYVFAAYYIAQKITRERALSFWIAILVFVSNGVFFHFTLTRTEPIAFLFLLGSVYCYIQYFNNGQGKHLFSLLLCLLMLFCGALNKAQVLVLAPFYFTWAFYFIPSDQDRNEANAGNWLKFASALSFIALGIFYSVISSGLSLPINLGLIGFFFALTFACSNRAGINAYKATAFFNVFYLIAFEVLSYFSFKLNQNVSIFSNIEDPISMTRWLAPDPNAEKIAMDSNSLYVLNKIASSLLEPLLSLLNRVSSPLILVLFCLVLMHILRKILSKKDILFGAYSFFAFYAVSLINRTRYIDAPHYLLLSEFFLLGFALTLILKLEESKAKMRAVGGLIFLILLVNLVPHTRYVNLLMRKGGQPFCSSPQIYLEKIDAQKITAECKGNPI
ncbi:phospholipid carrier-dependent glycosyltransferase [Polynucleobacter sp. MG-5-Ahmo-C2]|uniref:phospholipid carrier-dependent glycosyltransferase n=1 Tax=Polynucleobacter sp. MG-5-Ahmo-C2 TaxID=2081051 RepID=UPI001BFD28F3|nr:phospholipid carrier-dependent glycosyltransferase [Polynucleobacter sp. MG-5-Ahmo-C2]QWD98844.1 phospholipid carrier-dependent glycosyltransferase [Polynucleobacter sp. MG-5-Ahmo-C2]